MCDNVCVDVRAQVEAYADTARVGGGVCVGDLGDPRGVGEAEGDGRGRVIEMGCGGELFGFWGGCEDAIEHQTASMSYSGVCQLNQGGKGGGRTTWTEAGMFSEYGL